MGAQILYWDGAAWELLASGGTTTPPSGGPFDRSTIILGTTRPVRDVTTGVLPDVARTDIFPANEGVYSMTAGQTLQHATIHGRLRIPGAASNCTVRNVRVMGSPPNPTPGINEHLPLLDIGGDPSGVVIEDCTFMPRPEYESPQVYGLKGGLPGGGVIRRSVFARCVDAVQTYDKSLTLEHCWLGDPLFFNPDPTRSDGDAVHSDAIQWEGGDSTAILRVHGCEIDNRMIPLPPPDNGFSLLAILFTHNRGQPYGAEIIDSWIQGGTVPLNLPVRPSNHLTITGNRIRIGQQHAGHIMAKTVVQNMWTLSGNVDLSAWEADPTTTAPITVLQG